jgi:hypothetical protein
MTRYVSLFPEFNFLRSLIQKFHGKEENGNNHRKRASLEHSESLPEKSNIFFFEKIALKIECFLQKFYYEA